MEPNENKSADTLHDQLRKQLEFYFGDANLSKDRFLRQRIIAAKHATPTHLALAEGLDGTINESLVDVRGMIDLRIVAEFNRMKDLSKDFGAIVAAARSSSFLKVVVVNLPSPAPLNLPVQGSSLTPEDSQSTRPSKEQSIGDGQNGTAHVKHDLYTPSHSVALTLVGRVQPLPRMESPAVDARTVYVEGLPLTTNHDTLAKAFSCYGPVLYVSIPRFPDRSIKGFAFVEFASFEAARAATQNQTAYVSTKSTSHGRTIVKSDSELPQPVFLKALPKMEWLRLKEEYKKLQREAVKKLQVTNDQTVQHNYDSHTSIATKGRTTDSSDDTGCFTKGVIVRLNNLNPNTRKSKLKEAFMPYAKVAFVDFIIGKTTGHVRFVSAEEAQLFLNSFKSTASIQDGEKEVVTTLLEGELEQLYWANLNKQKYKKGKASLAVGPTSNLPKPIAKETFKIRGKRHSLEVYRSTDQNGERDESTNNKKRRRKKKAPPRTHIKFNGETEDL
eukprot:CFRG5428T1